MSGCRFIYRLLTTVFLLSLYIFSGCSKQAENDPVETNSEKKPTQAVRFGGIYRMPLLNNPTTLDPAYVQTFYGSSIVHKVFNGLVKYGPHLMVLPDLAETWQVEDQGTTYRFVLRKNARFHNGKPVTVEDVVFSIGRLLRADPPPVITPQLLIIRGAKDFKNHKSDNIEGIEPIDDRTFLIRLEEPHVPFLAALGMYHASIVPKEEVMKSGKKFGQAPIGSGPFRFISWEKDKSIRLERFSDYFLGAAFLDEIQFSIYPGIDRERVLEDFSKGNLEEMLGFGEQVRKKLSSKEGLQWFHRPSLSIQFYGIRAKHPLLKKPEIRHALSLVINREQLVRQAYKEEIEPAKSIIPPGMPGYNRQIDLAESDIPKAKEDLRRELKQIVGPFPPIEIVSNSKSPLAIAELNFVRETWAQFGIPVKIKYIKDWPRFEEYIKSDEVQIYRYAWFADMPDPDSILYPLFASDSPNNFMRYKNNEVDKKLIAARGETDPIVRAKLYQEIEAQILKDAPLIPLIHLSVHRVYQPYVRGIQVSALGPKYMTFHRVWLAEKPAGK